jgi:H-type lectin domain-containing protein
MSTSAADTIPTPQVFTGTQVIQTGVFYYGYAANPGEWHLNTGLGRRTFDGEIKFPQPYASPPQVTVSLTGLDTGNVANTRVTIEAQDVTAADFEVLVNTWADSVVYSVWGSWIAVGQV